MAVSSVLLMALIPILLIQFGLQIFALFNLYKRKKVRWDKKWIWLIIILCFNMVGPIVYFILVGEDE